MTSSYTGALPVDDDRTLLHEKHRLSGELDVHGNEIETYDDPVEREYSCLYPLHSLPHRDPVSADYMDRYVADYIVEVPDASIYSKNDRITILGQVFLVDGFPTNWGGNDPFGCDATMFGGSVYIIRVG